MTSGGAPWRTLPPKQCSTDPDFSYQGQWPPAGYWHTYTDPQSGKTFRVWEGHYTYPGTNLTFVPTYAGGMFEGLMANLVVPETTWGPHSLGLDDLRWPQVQIKYATQVLKYPVWGISPSSTADDSGGYGGFGVEGLDFRRRRAAWRCARPARPRRRSVRTRRRSRSRSCPSRRTRTSRRCAPDYPGIYTPHGGFYDAVNPETRLGRPPPAGA